jgi:hypothetical protein
MVKRGKRSQANLLDLAKKITPTNENGERSLEPRESLLSFPVKSSSPKEPKFTWRDAITIIGILISVGAITDLSIGVRLSCFFVAAVCFWVSLPFHKQWPRLARLGLPLLATVILAALSFQIVKASQQDTRNRLPSSPAPEEKPRLAGVIEQITVGDVRNSRDEFTGKPDKYTLVLLAVAVKNLGAASIANEYELRIMLPDKSVQIGKEMIFPGPMKIDGHIYSSKSGWLEQLTAQDPIQKNGQRTGYLYFEFDYGQAKLFETEGVIFSLSFHDALGTIYTATNEATRRIQDRQWLPMGVPIPDYADSHAVNAKPCQPALTVGDNATLDNISTLSVGPCSGVKTGKNTKVNGLKSVVTEPQPRQSTPR